jgi:hypothetical protein
MRRRSAVRPVPVTAAIALGGALWLMVATGCSSSTPDTPTTTEHDMSTTTEHDMSKMTPNQTMAP